MSLSVNRRRWNIDISLIIIVILEVLSLFAPRFRVFSKYSWLLAMIGLVLLILKVKIDKTTLAFFLLFALNIAVCLLANAFNATDEIQYIVFMIGTMLSFLRNFVIVYAIQRERTRVMKSATIRYMEVYVYTCVVYVMFTLLFIAVPSFKEFWFGSVIEQPVVMQFTPYQFRYSLDGFAAFSAATFFSLTVLFAAYLIVHAQDKRELRKYYITYVIIVVGCFFYGRICLISIGLSALYIMYFTIRSTKILKIIGWTAIVAAFLLILLDYLISINPVFLYWKDWAFGIIHQIFSGDGITDYSVNHLFEDMYFLPEFKTFILGDGRYYAENGTSYYGHTDVGFLRSILYFGIAGCLINYSMVLLYVKKLYAFFKKEHRMCAFLLLVLLVFVILEMKGEAYHRILTVISPLYYTRKFDIKHSITRDMG